MTDVRPDMAGTAHWSLETSRRINLPAPTTTSRQGAGTGKPNQEQTSVEIF